MVVFAVLLFLVSGFAFLQLRFIYKRRRLSRLNWEAVIARVESVDLEGIRRIAEPYLSPDSGQLSVETDVMWEIVGGLKGLEVLSNNAAAMLDLAVYAERWNDATGPLVSEMIRMDAVRLNRAVSRIQMGFFFHAGFVRTPFYVQEAAAYYYLIRGRLLGLYQLSHVGLIPALEQAI